MLALPLFTHVREVLCLGAHCDDVEIGCGGTLMTLARTRPDCRIRLIVLSGDPNRQAESRAAFARLLPNTRQYELELLGFKDGYFPAQWSQIKAAIEALKPGGRPDLILTHFGDDRHQDHRTVSELTWNTFRDHLIFEYEIPKWDGDLGRPDAFVPLERATVDHKIATLLECFASQCGRAWFTAELFSGLMRLRGMECNAPSGFAEAFHVRKVMVT